MTSPDTPRTNHSAPVGEAFLPCEEIQALMFDYIHQDLGEARSDVVREHIRRCPTCHAHLKELQDTLGILHRAPFAPGSLPMHLSDRHHSRLVRALMHPILDWVYVHHILVSALIATIAITVIVMGLKHYRFLKDSLEPGITVEIGDKSE